MLALRKPTAPKTNFADLYGSEVQSQNFTASMVSWYNDLVGGAFVTKDIAAMFAAGNKLAPGLVAAEFGQTWSGGDSPFQQIIMELYDPKFSRSGYIDFLDQSTHVLHHYQAIGNDFLETATTEGVDSLFNLGGIVDAAGGGGLYGFEYQGNMQVYVQAAISHENVGAWTNTYAGQLQAMYDGVAPYGSLSVTDEQFENDRFTDRLAWDFSGDASLVASAPDGTPIRAYTSVGLE